MVVLPLFVDLQPDRMELLRRRRTFKRRVIVERDGYSSLRELWALDSSFFLSRPSEHREDSSVLSLANAMRSHPRARDSVIHGLLRQN